MRKTTYYNLNIVDGSDIVNPMTVDNPNYEIIDESMHDNAVCGVTLATEIANARVHAITRENSECAVIRFIATSEWKAGDSVTVDGVVVTALLPSGEALPDGAYVINANVLCILTGTYLTVFAERKKIENANEIAYNGTTVDAALSTINADMAKVSHPNLKTIMSSVSTNRVSVCEVISKGGIVYVSANFYSTINLAADQWLTFGNVGADIVPPVLVQFPIGCTNKNLNIIGQITTSGELSIKSYGADYIANTPMLFTIAYPL